MLWRSISSCARRIAASASCWFVAAGEREQLADPLEHAIDASGLVAARPVGARRARIDAALARTRAAKRLAVRGLVGDAEHLVDVLVRHLVLEHAR